MSRKDFLATIVGILGTVVLGKLIGLKKVATTFHSLSHSKSGYGSSPYGGKVS